MNASQFLIFYYIYDVCVCVYVIIFIEQKSCMKNLYIEGFILRRLRCYGKQVNKNEQNTYILRDLID